MEDRRFGEENRRQTHWSLDRKIPIAIIVVVVIQAASFIWWASSQYALDKAWNEQQDRRIESIELVLSENNKEVRTISDRLIKLETHIESMASNVERLAMGLESHKDSTKNIEGIASDIRQLLGNRGTNASKK